MNRQPGIIEDNKLVDLNQDPAINRAVFIKDANFANVTGTSIFAQGEATEDIPIKASYDGENWFDLLDEEGEAVKVSTNVQGVLIYLVNIWVKADITSATSTDLIVALN